MNPRMIRYSSRSALLFFLIPALFATGNASIPPSQAAACDSLEVLKGSTYGCTNFRLKNRNAANEVIDRFWLEITTTGLEWHGGASVPSNWNVVQIAPNILEISGIGTALRPGVDLDVGYVCLSTVCQTGGDYTVRFKTFAQSKQICSGTVALSCDPLNPRDSLSLNVQSGNISCYNATLFNRSSAQLPLNGLEVTLLSPVGTISGSATNSWTSQPGPGKTIRFLGGNSYITSGTSAGGFQLCFGQMPVDKDTITLLWQSSFNDLPITIDTMHHTLARKERCDSVVFRQRSIEPDSSCYSATIFNLHEPAGPVHSMRLELLSDGAIFPSGATGPWPLVQETPIFLRWRTSGSGIAQTDSLGDFDFCIINTGDSDTVRLRVSTMENEESICSEEYQLYAPATQGTACDRFTSQRIGGDSYVLGFVNRRRPLLSVNRLEMEILSSGIRFDSLSVPLNWVIETAEDRYARTQTAVPVIPSASISGFFTRFEFSGQQDSVLLRLCTSLGGQNSCCDTITLPLTSEETRCDSLLLEASGDGNCTWRIGFVNTHLPPSSTTGFRLTPLDEFAAVTMQEKPEHWTVISDGSSGELYLVRDTATEDSLSFNVTFASAAGDSLFLFEWCTEDADGIICCGIDSVFCLPEKRCDVLESRPPPLPMSAAHRILNRHLPATPVDAVRFAVATPGAGIAGTDIPQQWTQELNAAGDTLRLIFDAPLPADSVSSWFTLQFSPAPGCDSIRYSWCTERSGADVCCGTAASIACVEAACDTVSVTPTPFRPCCFNVEVKNGLQGMIDRVSLRILTPGARLYNSHSGSPDGWDAGGDSLRVLWTTADAQVKAGAELDGFAVCYDNDPIGNNDFTVLWETYTGRTLRCSDTLTISCDRTLQVETVDAPVPDRVRLHPNFPNPFRGSTQLTFDLPEHRSVSMQVFDTHGRLVSSVCDGGYDAGRYRITFDASGMPAGVYLLRLSTDDIVLTRMMSLIR